MVKLPPLSLYIHIPWCVQKCPYCDFNSHALKGEVPHDDYVQHLLNDLDNDVAYAQGREVKTIFIGGGTPSLLSGPAMQTLLDGVRARLPLAADAEITMEANPGTVEAEIGVKKFRWVVLVVVVLACLLLWAQVFNMMCDQDVQFFSGICAINQFIPW